MVRIPNTIFVDGAGNTIAEPIPFQVAPPGFKLHPPGFKLHPPKPKGVQFYQN